MHRIQSMFLRGPAGVALVLLRFSVTLTLVGEARATGPAALLLLAGAVLLCAGALTPLAAAAALLHALAPLAAGGPAEVAAMAAALQSAALLIAGPGAWSLDARLFGRRQVFDASNGDETGT